MTDAERAVNRRNMLWAECPECGGRYMITQTTWILHRDYDIPLPPCSDCDDTRQHNYAVPYRAKEQDQQRTQPDRRILEME